MIKNEFNFNLELAIKGFHEISISGVPGNSETRKEIIEEAIAISRKDNTWGSFCNSYFGAKDYDRFRDQRCDLENGYRPSNGYIVFRIRKRNKDVIITDAGIYLLLLQKENLNLSVSEVIRNYLKSQEELSAATEALMEINDFNNDSKLKIVGEK